eukprot:928247-Prymnesium_polylepis.1
MSRTADIVLWTSAMESYVSEIVEQLDPNGDRFTAVLTRADCHDLQDGSQTTRFRSRPTLDRWRTARCP